jgi:GT2 family glycosyltransferase
VTTPRVAVLVVNRNGRSHLETCLPSLAALDYPAGQLEVVLVDNASTDDSIGWTRAAHPGVRVIRYDRNLGFAQAYNEAIARTDAEFVALLNNDTRVDPAWLAALVSAADRHGASAVGSLMLDWEGKRVDFAGGITSIVGHAWSDLDNRPASEAPRED